ncbi:hypothetical protein [Streptomyces sporangiiformans]
MPAATERVVAAYEAAGFTVELAHQNSEHTYTRLNTDPVSGIQNKVELVAEFLNNPPVPSELGPVLHPDDVAAWKTIALDGRAEVRDAIDVDGLLKARVHVRRLTRPHPALHRQAIRRLRPYRGPKPHPCASDSPTANANSSLRRTRIPQRNEPQQ